MIDNLKKPGAISIIDESQVLKAISVIDKFSPINFSDNRCGKFSMCLTKFFFLQVNRKNVLLDFSRKESSTRTLPWH